MLRKGLPLLLLCTLALLGYMAATPTRAQDRAPAPTALATVAITVTVAPPPALPTVDPKLEAQLPPYVPEEQIPLCGKEGEITLITPEMVGDGPGPFDFAKPPACRARSVVLPGPKAEHPVSNINLQDRPKAAGVGVADINTIVDCRVDCVGSTPFINSVYWVASAQQPSLKPNSWSWDNYGVASRVHVATSRNRTYSCYYDNSFYVPPNIENVSLGHVYGTTADGTVTGNYQLFYEDFSIRQDQLCGITLLSYIVAEHSSMYYNVYTTGSGNNTHYIGRIFLNGIWNQLFDIVMGPGAAYIDFGLEAIANHSDMEQLIVPYNYIAKQRYAHGGTIYPVYRGYLPYNMNDPYDTNDLLDSPWNRMDTDGIDFTATAANMNQ